MFFLSLQIGSEQIRADKCKCQNSYQLRFIVDQVYGGFETWPTINQIRLVPIDTGEVRLCTCWIDSVADRYEAISAGVGHTLM